jgi:hypothetical protein
LSVIAPRWSWLSEPESGLAVMYGHAFLRLSSLKNRDACFDKRAILDKIRHGRSRFYRATVFARRRGEFQGHLGFAQTAKISLKIQFERKLYFALIILTVAR